MTNPDFIYTTYIRSTAQKVWDALTTPEFSRQFWAGGQNISDWRPGSAWKQVDFEDQSIDIVGEVVESTPPTRLVLTWAAPADLGDQSRVTFELEQTGEMVRLQVVHGDFKPDSTMASKVSYGWPRVLSSLKSLLETGTGLQLRSCSDSACAQAA